MIRLITPQSSQQTRAFLFVQCVKENNSRRSILIIMVHVLEPKRLKSCSCWPKPHVCLVSSNEVLTCTPGRRFDELTVCCKVNEENIEHEKRKSELRRKNGIKIETKPDILRVLQRQLRWLRIKRPGRFVTYF